MADHPLASSLTAPAGQLTTGDQSAAHTPSPWRTDPESEHQWVLGADGGQVADCAIFLSPEFGQRTDAINQANARLIAAAPELYEAVAELLATHPAAYREPNKIDNRTDNAVRIARAALAKAVQQ